MPNTTDNDTTRLLIVDDKASMRSLLHAAFDGQGYDITTAGDGEEAIQHLESEVFDIIITDMKMPGKSGMDVLKAAKAMRPETHVIVVTAFGTIDTAVEAMRLGAADFIAKPFELAEMETKVRRLARRRKDRSVTDEVNADFHRPIVGNSEHTLQLLDLIARIGASTSTVLIVGPTGTGKELVARALHEAGPLRDRPFITLNCAALAPGVLESELFGHEKGAFTGAISKRIGRFEQAHGGTLFLDEVGDIDPGVQTKLLRVLQEGEIERVGGMESIKVDVRVIAATNRDLAVAMANGEFREDFYYRLNVFSVTLEPLRNRRADIPALIDLFLARFAPDMDKEDMQVDDDVIEIFMQYDWPGNVRELENVLERAAVLSTENIISLRELPPEMISAASRRPSESPTTSGAIPSTHGSSLTNQTDDFESERILKALEQFRWNKTKAAKHLGLKRTTLQYKIKKYGLE